MGQYKGSLLKQKQSFSLPSLISILTMEPVLKNSLIVTVSIQKNTSLTKTDTNTKQQSP